MQLPYVLGQATVTISHGNNLTSNTLFMYYQLFKLFALYTTMQQHPGDVRTREPHREPNMSMSIVNRSVVVWSLVTWA
jgi:hypothetical protein